MSNEDDFVASVNRLENLIDSNQQELKRTVDRTFGSLKDELNRLKSSRSALDQIHNVIALWDDRLFELCDLPIRIRNILEGVTVNNNNNHEQAHDLAESEVGANVTVEPANNLDGNLHLTEEHVNVLGPNVPSTVNDCNINESNSSVLGTKNVTTSTSVIPTNIPKAKDVSNQQSVPAASACISGGSTSGLNSRSLWPVCNCPSPHPHVDMHQEVKQEVKEEEEEKVDKGDEPANDSQNELPTTKQSKTGKRRATSKSLAIENCSLENGLTSGEVTTLGSITKRTRVSSLGRRVTTEQLSTGSGGDLSNGDDPNGNVSSGEEEVKVEQATIQSKRKSVPSNDQSNKKMKPVGQIRDANAEDGNKVKTIYLNCTELECKEHLKSIDDLRQHLTTKHGLLPYKCYARGCNDRCENRRGISIHIRDHHTDSTQFVCPICDRQFPLQGDVTSHLYSMHFTGKFQCNIVDECKQVGDTRYEIILHVLRYHRARTQLQCDRCSLKFANQTNLNAHYICHTRFNPFRCTWPDCVYQTNLRRSIIQHIRVVHFLLPVTKRERIALNIVDDRDPADYIEEVTEQED